LQPAALGAMMKRRRSSRALAGRVVAEQVLAYDLDMSTVEEITNAVKRLPKKDLTRFRRWFADYDAAIWDRQLEQDVAAGRLEKYAREALRDHKAGRTTAL
jgi:hypothetical protein